MSWLFHNDIFISYSSADSKWVAQLDDDLRLEFKVFRDQRIIEPGQDWLRRIKKELKRSLVGIVVLSPDALKSQMVNYEWVTLYNRLGRGGKLITLLYRDVPHMPELLKPINYIDFRDPALREKRLEELRKTIRDKLKYHGRGLALIKVLLLALMIMVAVPVIIKGARAYFQDNKSLDSLHRTQREVQSIEARLAGFINLTRARVNGEQQYSDPFTREHLVTDHWENGVLMWRGFYARGRLIARDIFKYDGGTVIEKIRYYMDEEQRPFLVDHFTQDGSLTKKRFCQQGPEQPCEMRMDDMRSPLPPPTLLLYR